MSSDWIYAACISVYLIALIVITVFAKRAERRASAEDFYLGNRTFGAFTLFFTLFATQYSGTTFLGVPATSYRQGFEFFVMMAIMISLVGVYGLFAFRLKRIADKHRLITPGDYLNFRFNSVVLSRLMTVIFLAVLTGYLLVNLKAVGYLVETASNGLISQEVSIIVACLFIVIYESIGGMRAVVWTDAMQGILILVGTLSLAWLLVDAGGGFESALAQTQKLKPEFWQLPATEKVVQWLSALFLIGFSAAVYPQAIQRIFAAKSVNTLVTSYRLMLVMPFLTTLIMLFIGIIAVGLLPDLTRAESEQVILLLLKQVSVDHPVWSALVFIFLLSGTAAIMSTVDSALLTMSSILTQDVLKPHFPDASGSAIKKMGVSCSWTIMGIACLLAVWVEDTIWALTVFKFELLAQAVPSMILSVRFRHWGANGFIAGALSGLAVAVCLKAGFMGAPAMPFNVHAGSWGLMVNVAVLLGVVGWEHSRRHA